MDIPAIFIIAKKPKATNISLNRQIENKPWYIHAVEYYLAIKRNELLNDRKTWRNLKCILLSAKASMKNLYTIRFRLYDILEKAELLIQ